MIVSINFCHCIATLLPIQVVFASSWLQRLITFHFQGNVKYHTNIDSWTNLMSLFGIGIVLLLLTCYLRFLFVCSASFFLCFLFTYILSFIKSKSLINWIKNDVLNTMFRLLGWNFFEISAEFSRQGANSQHWTLTTLNSDYSLCPTYPKQLMVPSSAQPSLVQGN